MPIELRPVRVEDAEMLFPLIYQTGVADTLLWDGPASLDEFIQALREREEQVKRGERHGFTIIESASGLTIGSASIRPDEHNFRADIGLWIGKPYQGKGFGTQVVRWLVEYGFDRLGLEKIESSVFVGNQASRRIFEKNGFSLEGTLRKAVRKYGQAVDEWLFGITREEYLQRKPALQQRNDWLLHICTAQAWQEAQARGEYRASSLETEGFIHASRPTQVLQVANTFYKGIADLLVLWIDPHRLEAELRWEPADGELFPHLYGPINLEAVSAVRELRPEADGVFRKLPGR